MKLWKHSVNFRTTELNAMRKWNDDGNTNSCLWGLSSDIQCALVTSELNQNIWLKSGINEREKKYRPFRMNSMRGYEYILWILKIAPFKSVWIYGFILLMLLHFMCSFFIFMFFFFSPILLLYAAFSVFYIHTHIIVWYIKCITLMLQRTLMHSTQCALVDVSFHLPFHYIE